MIKQCDMETLCVCVNIDTTLGHKILTPLMEMYSICMHLNQIFFWNGWKGDETIQDVKDWATETEYVLCSFSVVIPFHGFSKEDRHYESRFQQQQ